MQSTIRSLTLTLIIATGVGCAGTRSYEVSAHNQTPDTITLWLTKDGPPAEEGWLSPEELSERIRAGPIAFDLAAVPPGKTGYTGKVKGHFDSKTHAVLRVYRGNLDLPDMLEAPAKARIDYILSSGKNDLAVVDESGKLVVKPVP